MTEAGTQSSNKIFCACGCGCLINQKDPQGRFRQFKHGHHGRGKHYPNRKKPSPETGLKISKALKGKKRSLEVRLKQSKARQGSNNPAWIGGRIKTPNGYIKQVAKDHRRADRDGYVSEHILIFEESRQCCLLSWGNIHHKDRNRINNVWYNLQGMTNRQHMSIHMKLDMTGRTCRICNTSKTSGWYHSIHGTFLCKVCYNRQLDQW